MTGGLIQLVAYGEQDIHLTGNPQITFLKKVYKQHTNFSKESIPILLGNNPSFGKKITCEIERKGDLLHKIYLEIHLECSQYYNLETVVYDNGLSFIDYVEIEIGGQLMDKHYGEWMYIWTDLTYPMNKKLVLDQMLSPSIKSTEYPHRGVIYIPLNFWFNNNIGLALPLIALQYHPVKINVQFNSLKKIWSNLLTSKNNDLTLEMSSVFLYCDYIYLDTNERRYFAKNSHEYLIEQVQRNQYSIHSKSLMENIDLNLNHPVKELVWIIQNIYANSKENGLLIDKNYNIFNNEHVSNDNPVLFDIFNKNSSVPKTNNTPDTPPTISNVYYYGQDENDVSGKSLGNFIFNFNRGLATKGVNNKDQFEWATLKLNGSDRFRRRSSSYFRLVQRFQHHTGTGVQLIKGFKASDAFDSIEIHQPSIYMYSFAVEPEKHQPSGTCNFSRIDNAVLHLELHKSQNLGKTSDDGDSQIERRFRLYAINYNILKIESGMGGLLYTN